MNEPKLAINKEMLDSAISTLAKTYSQPDAKHIEQAIDFLRKCMHEKKEVEIVRADKVLEVSGIFIPFGVPWIDTWLRGGLRPQELMLIGAIPHAGKTHTLVWCGIQFLLEGYKVLDIIGEDLLSDVKDAYSQGLNSPEPLQNLWLANVQDVSFGVKQVEEIYDHMVQDGNKPDIIIIDHVDLMKGSSAKSDWEQVTDVMVALKMLAKRTGTIIITASQLTYDEASKGNARFYRAKVGKAANADVIVMIDDVVGDEYTMSLTKARGRKKIPAEERQKVILVSWSNMTMEDITR
jgi:predicted ATP-dependent serine protease